MNKIKILQYFLQLWWTHSLFITIMLYLDNIVFELYHAIIIVINWFVYGVVSFRALPEFGEVYLGTKFEKNDSY